MFLAWFDADRKKPIAQKIAEARERYVAKFGRQPLVCLVNPEDAITDAPIALRPLNNIGRNCCRSRPGGAARACEAPAPRQGGSARRSAAPSPDRDPRNENARAHRCPEGTSSPLRAHRRLTPAAAPRPHYR